jgi:hypothetical protein
VTSDQGIEVRGAHSPKSAASGAASFAVLPGVKTECVGQLPECASGQTYPEPVNILSGEGGFVARRLNSQQLNELSDELASLMKQQSDARLMEVFVRMSEPEIKAFDLRTARISQIHVILSEHDAKR